MNIKLSFNSNMMASVWYADQIHNNLYQLHIQLVTITDDPIEQNIAMDRLKYMMLEQLNSAVFIQNIYPEIIDKFNEMNIKVVVVPEEPVDQIIGMMLFSKLNAIMENRMLITTLQLSSLIGDSISYYHDVEDDLGPFTQEGWWSDSDARTVSRNGVKIGDKVVKITRYPQWKDVGLEWSDGGLDDNTVVFGKFDADED